MSDLPEGLDGLYDATPLEIHTEQALLGALLLAPSLAAQVRDWLEAEDFYRPAHQEVYTTLLAYIDSPAYTPESDSLEQTLMIMWERIQHIPNFGALGLYELVERCPKPAHVTAYALMVVEADTRRAVALHIMRLAQTLERHRQDGKQLPALFAAAESAKIIVARLGERLDVPDLSSVVLRRLDAEPAIATAPDRVDLDHQDQLLSALIAAPHQINQIHDLLDAGDFSDPYRGQLFTLLITMAENKAAIDLVTVMGQAQRAGLLPDPRQETFDRFQEHFGEPGPASVLWLTQRVQESSALAYASAAVIRLTNAAALPGLDPRELLAFAAQQLQTLTARQPYHLQPLYQPPALEAPALEPSAQAPRL
ncbi:DnaB-like helicase N-terminal domain-containing protein [Streptosporangium sp. CA-115845]|uniref:DnaB-like helicase N-terminal domain-containing protein n=1 Tax=Streptosporangium sp. CA-115845 TaxID=3240071 RepID=UPI003D8F82EE